MSIREKHKFQNDSLTKEKKDRFLILHNDDVHTFDYVIDALIDVCQHDT
ncbi:MAG: ATP-dependent Clp protease adaptor ClpS, partial [Bacteroidota bacterium]|nr:ATP-dependent Clp protease adaptor ClpS [Bacteroidota bacterium]